MPRAAVWQRLQLLPQLSDLTQQRLHRNNNLHNNVYSAADIAPLSNLRSLQRLDLRLATPFDKVDESTARALLSALQHLTQLQHLQLYDMALDRVTAQHQQQGESHYCFSALTASTQLTALHIENVMGLLVPPSLPEAAVQHMFPPGHVLPHLKVLRLDLRGGWPCVDAAQVAMIAASCPALQQLELSSVTPKGFDVSCLAKLPSGVTKVEGLNWTRPLP
jgi:hypothetical protein